MASLKIGIGLYTCTVPIMRKILRVFAGDALLSLGGRPPLSAAGKRKLKHRTSLSWWLIAGKGDLGLILLQDWGEGKTDGTRIEDDDDMA